MDNNNTYIQKKFKSFYIICLLCFIFIVNSYYLNQKRNTDKEKKGKTSFTIFEKRFLEGINNTETKEEKYIDINQVCSRGSKNLNSYYKSGSISELDIDDEPIKYQDKDNELNKAIIFLLRKYFDFDNENANNLIKNGKSDKDNFLIILNNYIPMLIFFCFGLISIFGWIICIVCFCCDCCCCCYCKKAKCFLPIYVFTFLFYILIIITSIIGLIRTNKIFNGLADIECSFLKIFDQFIIGETKDVFPKWIGIDKIIDIFEGLKINILNFDINTIIDLSEKKDKISLKRNEFSKYINNFDNFFYNKGIYHNNYTISFNNLNSLAQYKYNYVLDMIKFIGHKNELENFYPNNTFLYEWKKEYSFLSEQADIYINNTKENYDYIIKEKSRIIESINKTEEALDKLKIPFNKIKDRISEEIVDYSKKIDKYGKIIIKTILISLIIIIIFLAVLISSLNFFFLDCCICRFLYKIGVHFLWNILALMMILTLTFGSIFSLFGKLGEKGISILSFIVSEENIWDENSLFLHWLDNNDTKKYLNICIHGNGNLENEFNSGNILNSIKNISDILNNVNDINKILNEIKETKPTYNRIQKMIINRTQYLTSEFGLLSVDNYIKGETNITLKNILEKFNSKIAEIHKYEIWDINGDKTKICDKNKDFLNMENNKFHPLTCKPIDRDWINNDSTDIIIKDYAILISAIVDLVQNLNNENSDTFKNKLDKLNIHYNNYLDSYINILNFLEKSITNLIGEIKKEVGKEQIFSFMDGKFIRINIKIILKYLKKNLGKDLFTLGIIFIIIGISLILSISSTILLNIIIKINRQISFENERQKFERYCSQKKCEFADDNISFRSSPHEKPAKVNTKYSESEEINQLKKEKNEKWVKLQKEKSEKEKKPKLIGKNMEKSNGKKKEKINEEKKKKLEEEEKIKSEDKKRKKSKVKIKELEEEKLKDITKIKEVLENQKKLREKEKKKSLNERDKNEKINEVLEDMCIYGNITKKLIKEEKKKNPEKFISTNQALKLEKTDQSLFALGLISQDLESMGIETAIENSSNSKDITEEGLTSLQFLMNGMLGKKKYDLHFEFGKKRNEELLNNKKEYEKFKKNLKLKLSKDYDIPTDKIIVTFPQKGSYHVQVIFQSDEFNNLDIDEFKSKFKNDPEFKELSNLKDIHSDMILGGCKLSKDLLDPKGNRNDGWAIGEKRGGKPYDPPLGYIGIGLKVLNKYDSGNNAWIGMKNIPGEWCVAYHGIGRNKPLDIVKQITGIIAKTQLKQGKGQVHKNHEDQFHPGKKVGEGVYCTPNIKIAADKFSGLSEINGIKYKTVLMVRVKPEAIRQCKCADYWVVNGTTDEIRPYRILYKKC